MAKEHKNILVLLFIIQTLVLILAQISAQIVPLFACDFNPNATNYKFCDTSVEIYERVNDLVKRLRLDEKVGLLVHEAKGIERLRIPNYNWWNEALHGVATSPGVTFEGSVRGATSFPQVILTAASFNVTLFEAIGKVVSTEARAMYNEGLAGLTYWAPNVNIFRDPRWGRGQETPGEDPFLTSKYLSAYVRGLQQREDGDLERLKVAACCKHYTAYDLDNWKGIDRFRFDAKVTKQDMEDTYQPPFKSCVVEGNVASVMCSYNRVNGEPMCADKDLLEGVVRGDWNLNGYIVTDCGAVDINQHYAKSPEDAAAKALLAGVDLNCGNFLKAHTENAVNQGLINVSTIDRAVSNNIATLMRLGFFDGNPRRQLYGNLGRNDVCKEEHQELAREAARQGIVLLKNTKGSLPLSRYTGKVLETVALIGPHAYAQEAMLGNYRGIPCQYTSPSDGIPELIGTIVDPGCENVFCETPTINETKQTAAEADAVILVMGGNLSIEDEGRDRIDLTLPGKQQLLVTEVAEAANGPVILVIMSGGGVDVQFAKDNDKITSILWVGYPGQAGGAAMFDVIFGDYNPGGVLPMSWYPQSYAETVQMINMNMRPDPSRGYPGRTYRFYNGPIVYEFGYGLSYTKFATSVIQAPKLVSIPLEKDHICRTTRCKSIDTPKQYCENIPPIELYYGVKNEGEMSGSFSALLFDFPPNVHNAPKKRLVAFEKVFLVPKDIKIVFFKIDLCNDLSVVDEFGNRKIALGSHLLQVGSVTHDLNVVIKKI